MLLDDRYLLAIASRQRCDGKVGFVSRVDRQFHLVPLGAAEYFDLHAGSREIQQRLERIRPRCYRLLVVVQCTQSQREIAAPFDHF